MPNVSEVMTAAPATIAPDLDVHEASLLMEERRIRHLPVVDGDKVVGMITERNVLEASGWAIHAGGRVVAVGECMRVPVVATSPGEDLRGACERLVEWRVGALPVLDRGVLVGIVTEIDVMRAFLRWIDGGGAPPEANPVLSRRMTRRVVSVTSDTPLGDAIEVLRDERIRHVPLVDDGRVVGILSDRDVRLCLGRGQSVSVEVGVVATPKVETIAPERPLSECVEILVLEKIGALPVVDARGRLVGMLTTMDVLEHCAGLEWS